MSSPYHTPRRASGARTTRDDGAPMDAYNEAVERYKREHNLASGRPQALSPSVGAKPAEPPPARAPRARSARGDDARLPRLPRALHLAPRAAPLAPPRSGRGARRPERRRGVAGARTRPRGYDDAYRAPARGRRNRRVRPRRVRPRRRRVATARGTAPPALAPIIIIIIPTDGIITTTIIIIIASSSPHIAARSPASGPLRVRAPRPRPRTTTTPPPAPPPAPVPARRLRGPRLPAAAIPGRRRELDVYAAHGPGAPSPPPEHALGRCCRRRARTLRSRARRGVRWRGRRRGTAPARAASGTTTSTSSPITMSWYYAGYYTGAYAGGRRRRTRRRAEVRVSGRRGGDDGDDG